LSDFFLVSGPMHLHYKRYICAAIPAAELLSFPPFLETWRQERDWAGIRPLCLTHCLCSGPFQVATRIKICNEGLDALPLHVLSLKDMGSSLWKP